MQWCVIIPTYNNASTLEGLIRRVLTVWRQLCPHSCNQRIPTNVIVVNDGSTDNTAEILKSFDNQISVVSYAKNRGKGYALKQGFVKAKSLGYDFAVTIDADGQHFPEDIPLLFTIQQSLITYHNSPITNHQSLVVGCRNLRADGMPSQNSFANRFSNFWFRLQTAQKLPDTQSGFRLYNLHALPSLSLLTNRYESELELLVLSAWRGVKLLPVPVRVYYPPENERVSHFRPFADFFRISVLNAILCLFALLYGYPRMLLNVIVQPISVVRQRRSKT